MKTVIKRDGRKATFDITRIKNAILAAMNEVGTVDAGFAMDAANKIENICPDKISVEDIQNLVEKA